LHLVDIQTVLNSSLYKIKSVFLPFTVSLLLAACAVLPPVQEMSDARQALDAARQARAATYAPQQLHSAEDSMELATSTLNQGNYEEARMAARVAKALAIKARDAALAAQGQ